MSDNLGNQDSKEDMSAIGRQDDNVNSELLRYMDACKEKNIRIKDLEAQLSKSQWVSVEADLPQYDNDVVLVAVCPPTQMNGVHMACRRKGRWVVLDESGNHADFITKWQPLPEVPK
jgi:hypothetical protein